MVNKHPRNISVGVKRDSQLDIQDQRAIFISRAASSALVRMVKQDFRVSLSILPPTPPGRHRGIGVQEKKGTV